MGKGRVYIICALAGAMAFATFACIGASAKREKVPSAYLFGFSGSFTDSTIYFTQICEVDSVWIDTKTNFLLGRDNYAYQLKDYFADVYGEPTRTCIVFYSLKKKDIDKKYAKLKAKYTTKSKAPYDVRFLDDTFVFRAVDMETVEYVEEKKDKKDEKPTLPDGEDRQGPPNGGMGGPPSGGMGGGMSPM